MARNWAEEYSNSEETLFVCGKWSVKKDGEGTLSVYFDETFKGISNCYKYIKFDKGFLLYQDIGVMHSFYLYDKNLDSPIFILTAKDASMKIDNDFISFYKSDEDNNPTIFNKESLIKVHLTLKNQIGFEF